MAEGPSNKKRRTEHEEETPNEEKELIERSITLNLSEYPDWVRRLRDEELVEVFKIGVLVRESLQMTVNSNQNHLKEVLESQLDSQMKPVQDKVASIGVEVSKKVQEIERKVTQNVSKNILDMTNAVSQFKQDVNGELTQIKTGLVTNVSEVANKVLPLDSLNTKIDDSKDKILKEMRDLSKSVEALGKPNTKGRMGESTVLEILKDAFPNFSVQHSAKIGKSGDVLVTTPEVEAFLIEVKNHDNPITKQEIEKFEKDVEGFPEAKVGIMLSLRSGIARRSKRGKFEIFQDKNKYFIYVPNAMKEENLIVWSVMLANELAQLNAELKDNQKLKLRTLYEDFKKSIESAKTSRGHLESLEATVKKLKESIEPILKIVEKSKTDLGKMLR